MTTVDIISSVLDGERFLPELLDSLTAQTHTDWRLWIRDDGSTDRTVDILRRRATEDSRIHIVHTGGPPLGVAGAYGWMLERVPADAAYVMCADADDVWLPTKIATTLDAMRAAERAAPSGTPLLVHTDLTLVDESLRTIHRSFWSYAGIDPSQTDLRRLVTQNICTAPTVMLNRALVNAVGSTPAEAMYQDWWYALVAAAFGRIVSVPQPTVLYRQHGANAVGARRAPQTVRELPAAIARRVGSGAQFRRDLARTAAQARAFNARYGERLDASSRAFLGNYARIPERSMLRRKIDLLRYRTIPNRGLLSMVGIFLRG